MKRIALKRRDGRILLARRKRRVRVYTHKLRRPNVGLWNPSGLIELDSRLTQRQRLKYLLHESLHEAIEVFDEEAADALSITLGKIMWEDGWRRATKRKK